ncbi:MAG: glutamate--tRNA ligase [Alphaproteobacteria bacterium]
MTVRVRFAPSPTGDLHIGGARTALFNYLFAKNNAGKFLLRIEDTDFERSTKEAVNAIFEGLDWLGICADESVVYQSKNQKRHQEVAYKLLENDKAYFCYTSASELEEMRSQAQAKGEIFRFQSPWRNKIMSQQSSVKPVIRLKSPQEGFTIIKDLVQGEISVANNEIDDLVMLRSDGTPTYMLAVVVDDHDMEISHIIRGDDHLTNAFRQKIIYQANDWQVPNFAHIPLIHGADGSKMSKRHGATSVIEYKNLGYLPQALRNYLLRLGWSNGDDEIISDEMAIKLFNLDNVGKSPSRFDFAKLNHINKFYIKNSKNEELIELLSSSNLGFDDLKISSQKYLKVINFSKEKVENINDLTKICQIFSENYRQQISENDQKILSEKINLIKDLKDIFTEIELWNHDIIKTKIEEYCQKNNFKIKDFAPVLRIALTFSSASAGGIFEILEILKKDEVINRINLVL